MFQYAYYVYLSLASDIRKIEYQVTIPVVLHANCLVVIHILKETPAKPTQLFWVCFHADIVHMNDFNIFMLCHLCSSAESFLLVACGLVTTYKVKTIGQYRFSNDKVIARLNVDLSQMMVCGLHIREI